MSSNLKYSEVESKRFGKSVFRGYIGHYDIRILEDFYAQNDPDVLIVRIPVAEQHKLHSLNTLNKDIIFADTLVYYQVDLKKATLPEINTADFTFVEAGMSHNDAFESLVSTIFVDYTNHYFSNPTLDKKRIIEGYREWATGIVNSPNNLSVLIYRDDKPIGFIICSYDADSAEIILNGVLPEYQSLGAYTQLVRYVKGYFMNKGMPILKVSTQIQNFRVQKVWNREGLVLTDAFVTLHLNKKG